MRFGLRLNICARPRRPTVDGAPPLVHLHNLYAGRCRAGPPLTGRRTTCISIAFTFATPRATSPPRPTAHAAKIGLTSLPGRLLCGSPRTLPCRARCFFLYWPSGPDGTTHFPGNLALCHAHHAAKIGQRAFRSPARNGNPRTLPRRARCFFFIIPGGVRLATYLPGWPGGQLFVNFSHVAVPAIPVWR